MNSKLIHITSREWAMIGRIFKAVEEAYAVSHDEIMSRSRTEIVSDARQMAMYLIWRNVSAPVVELAELFQRSHPNFIYAIHKIEDRLDFDRVTREKYQHIRQALEPLSTPADE